MFSFWCTFGIIVFRNFENQMRIAKFESNLKQFGGEGVDLGVQGVPKWESEIADSKAV